MVMGMNYSPEIQDLAHQLKIKTMEVLQLRETISELRLQVAEYKTEKLNDKIALFPLRYYREKGYFKANNPYARDPEHFRKVWSYCQKYQYLLSPEVKAICVKDKFDPVKFAFLWNHCESHFKANLLTYNYKEYDKYYYITKSNTKVKKSEIDREIYYDYLIVLSKDNGMAQINDVVWDILYARLPEELKKRKNPKVDPEVAIAMLYLWMSDRTKNNMSWCLLSDESWTMFWLIGEIEKNG